MKARVDFGKATDEEKLRILCQQTSSISNAKRTVHTAGKYQKETWISGNEGRATNGKYLDKYKEFFPLLFLNNYTYLKAVLGEGFNICTCKSVTT